MKIGSKFLFHSIIRNAVYILIFTNFILGFLTYAGMSLFENIALMILLSSVLLFIFATIQEKLFMKRFEKYMDESLYTIGRISEDFICRKILLDSENKIVDISDRAMELLDRDKKSLLGVDVDTIIDMKIVDYNLVDNRVLNSYRLSEANFIGKNDKEIPIFMAVDNITYMENEYKVISFLDISILRDEILKRKHLETELIHNNKLESIGTLAAGIAHEINSPVQFVGNNIEFLDKGINNLFSLVDAYEGYLFDAYEDGKEVKKEMDSLKKKHKFKFLKNEMPEAVVQSDEGIKRITDIVRAMKDFSHMGDDEMHLEDVNSAIKSTVTLSKNEWKYYAKIDMNLDENLPFVNCVIGDIKQVVLNLIVNAAHAIKEKNESSIGRIKISTYEKNKVAFIEVEDDGCGIDDSIKESVFRPFFTTKEVGVGTGQGLSISQQIITGKHKGKLSFESELGKGTIFRIELPVASGGGIID